MTNTRTFSPHLARIGKFLLWITGWGVEGDLPEESKFVVAFAPHTSNLDGLYLFSSALYFGFMPKWMGKAEVFIKPIAPLLRAMGGIPVDRKRSMNLVDQVVEQSKQEDLFILGIAPEGTRYYRNYWKAGFYHIALKGGMPICMASIDYKYKKVIFSETVIPSGNLSEDLLIFQEFFKDAHPHSPEFFGPVAFKPHELKQK